jgi:hypothetical protein
MKRLATVPLLLFAFAIEFPAAANSALAAPVPDATDDDKIEDLKKTLNEVLRARREEEFAFVDRVMNLVKNGTLPRSVVVSTFNWARKKPRYPFQYFEHGLRERAKQIGVHL